MADQINNVEIRLALKQAVQSEAKKIVSALNSIGSAGEATGKRLATGLFSILGGVGLSELVKKSLDLAKASEENQARLSIAVNGNITQFNALKDTIANVSKSSVFSINELTGATEQLIERGVGADKVPAALQAMVNTASALRIPLEDVGKQIAITFGGTVPRELSRAVPALKQLTEEELKAGGALDVLGKAFEGRAAAFAGTDSGREAAAMRDIAQAWTDIGKAMLPIEQTLLPGIAKGFQDLDVFLENLSHLTPSSIVGNFLAAHGVEIVGFNDGPDSTTSDATAALAAKKRSDLLAEAKDAGSRQEPLIQERNELELNGLQELNKKRESEVARSTEEEFKTRIIGLQKYLDELEKSHADETDRIARALANTQEHYGAVTSDLHAAAHSRNSLLQTGDPAKDALTEEARAKLQIQITADLERQVRLKQQLEELEQQSKDADRSRMDAQAKAIDEAIKAIPANATTGAKSVIAGNESGFQLQSQIHQQIAEVQAALPATFKLAEKLLPPAEAKAFEAKWATMLADAKDQAQKTADAVTPIIGDLQAIGGEARKAATDGLTNALTDVETHAKSASQALGELAQGFIRSMLQIINQRLAAAAVNAIAGTGENGNNGLIGAAASGVGSLVSNLPSLIKFASGGYTGDGPPDQLAGIVHKGEFVLPADVVQANGLHRASVSMFRDRSARGFTGLGGGGSSAHISELTDSIRELASRPVVPVTHIDAEGYRQIVNGNGHASILADHMGRNPEVFKSVIRRLAN